MISQILKVGQFLEDVYCINTSKSNILIKPIFLIILLLSSHTFYMDSSTSIRFQILSNRLHFYPAHLQNYKAP